MILELTISLRARDWRWLPHYSDHSRVYRIDWLFFGIAAWRDK